MEKRLTATLNRVQKQMKTDIFEFTEVFERKYPQKWEEIKNNWEKIFPTIEVTFDIEAHILRTGEGSAQ